MICFVKHVNKEKKELCFQKMSKQLRDEGANKKPEVLVKQKNHVGRPRKPNPLMATAFVATSTPMLEQFVKRSRSSKGSYIN